MTDRSPTSGGGHGKTRLDGALRSADRATTFVERPIRRATRADDLNPLPHAGTITVFLLGVVIVSGLYITLFFSFGHAASYDAVASMEDHAIQRMVRALHRYSSAALVLTTLVHAWRIFAAQRFTSARRRWRWATGIASLALVWLAGVSGYWLVWDRRAAAISEVTAQLLKPFGWADGFVVHNLLGHAPGSGAGFLLFLWFVHLLLTAAIGWFVFRHLRRSTQAWLPPSRWMAMMGGALLLLSLVLPLGMLEPARPDQLVTDMPIDPFVLFLLPPLLSSARWLAVAAMVLAGVGALFLPRLLRVSDAPPVEIDEELCTGCEICVVDCPYDALAMSEVGRSEPKAILDAGQCVACGICVGSCAFDAIELPGWRSPARDVDGRTVRVMCDRHEPTSDDGAVIVPVSCAAMFAPNATRGYVERGATKVELVGCAPSECRYGVGNSLAAERIDGVRAPHPPRRHAANIEVAWLNAGESSRTPAEDSSAADGGSRLVAPLLVVLLSVFGVVAATRAPFRPDGDKASLRVILDHTSGAPLVTTGSSAGQIQAVEVVVDGQLLERHEVSGDVHTVGFNDWNVSPGTRQVDVSLEFPDSSVELFTDIVDLDPSERLVVTASDIPPAPGSGDGQAVFESRAAGCDVCHSIEAGRELVGPSLYGVADVAASRVAGLNAEQYFRQSILLPDQYIVEGWPSGQMLPIYRDRLTERELESLLAFLGTLTEESP